MFTWNTFSLYKSNHITCTSCTLLIYRSDQKSNLDCTLQNTPLAEICIFYYNKYINYPKTWYINYNKTLFCFVLPQIDASKRGRQNGKQCRHWSGCSSEAVFRVYTACPIWAYTLLYGPRHAKMCLMPDANNKGADQPAHPRSLISTFVVRCLDSMICMPVISKVSRF